VKPRRHPLPGPAASNAFALAGGTALSALASWLLVRGGFSAFAGIALGLAGIFALLRWPALTVLSLLVVCQEIDPGEGFGGSSSSGLLFLGHQIYFTTISRVSLLTFAMLVAGAGTALRRTRRRPRPNGALLVLILGGWAAALVWLGGASLTTAINQDSLFALLFTVAFFIGSAATGARDWSEHALSFFRWLFTLMALVGAYLYATGQGDAVVGINVIFYDSALGAIAGAFVVAVLLAPSRSQTRQVWWAGAAALVVVILSSRRDVWAAMAVALIIGLAVTRNRTRVVLRMLAAIGVILVGLALLESSLLAAIGHQLSAVWEATQGSAADASVKGHLSDVSIGWQAIKASPLRGVGPSGHVVGLVVENTGPLYIHNQILESWLRFGLVGAALVVLVQLVLMSQGVGALRRDADSLTTSWAAYLLLIAPIAMLTAPFFTNTQRWPAILGFAAGLVATRRAGQRAPVRLE
jgi:O-antigen ligase